MFKYTKRLISDIRFWSKELKLRRKEYAELEQIEDEAMSELCHPMAGYAFYKDMQRNQTERKRLHQEQRSTIK